MELRTFIRTALVDIVRGVEEAQNEIGRESAVVGVPVVAYEGQRVERIVRAREDITESPTTIVDFDVAVTASEGSSDSVGGGAKIHILSFGANTSTQTQQSSVSRITFAVPVKLPLWHKKEADSARI